MLPELYKLATELNGMAVFEWDIINNRLNYDSQMTRLLQNELPTENVKKHLLQARLIHPENRIEFQNHVKRMLEMKTQRSAPFQDYELEFRIYTRDRYFIWVKMKYRAEIVDGVAIKILGFIKNVDSAHIKEAKLKEVIERDAMTGLYSKTHAPYLVNQILSDKDKMNALLVLDLDNFKSVNDKLGHLIGDAVIMDMAMNLKTTFRKTDILGHIGGDEFMVLMKDIKTPDIVLKKCSQLRDILRKVYQHEGEEVSVSASIGIALAPEHGANYNILFERADAALAESKRQGKDTETIYSEGLENAEQRAADNAELPTQNFRKMLSNPLEYIFQMVFNSKDTSLAVQLLLQIFAKYFKVHRAYVFWHMDGPHWPKILFDYVRGDFKKAEIAHDPPLRLQIRKRYRNTKNGRFSECADTSKLPERAKHDFERRNIHSYLECAVMDGEDFIGCVGFDDCKKARTWTKEEHEILFSFSEIMRRFLFGQIYFEMKKHNGRWSL